MMLVTFFGVGLVDISVHGENPTTLTMDCFSINQLKNKKGFETVLQYSDFESTVTTTKLLNKSYEVLYFV